MTDSHAVPAREDRRTRWVREENARRTQRYDQDLAAWRSDAAELDWMLSTARTFTGSRDSQLDLKRHELTFFELAQAHVVEEPAGRAVMPGPSTFSFRSSRGIRLNVSAREGAIVTGSPIVKVHDHGRLTITNHRVVLQGQRNNREWSFAKLTDLGHDDHRPLTLMQVSNRQKVSGVLHSAADTARMRFFLGLALAHSQDNVQSFIEDLEQQRFEHVGTAPMAPPVARPAEAPGGGLPAFGRGLRTVYFGKRGWARKTRVLQGVATVGITLIALSALATPDKSATASHNQTKFVSTSSAASPSRTRPTASTTRTTPRPAPSTTAVVKPKLPATQSAAPRTSVVHVPAPITTHPAAPNTTVAPVPPPPPATPEATCYPLTNGGNCYEPGEFCRKRDHGANGVAGDGEAITCEDNNGWRWEPTG